MGKRELVKRPRLERDWYGTKDPAAVAALTGHMWEENERGLRTSSDVPQTYYIEPCAGDGSLIDLLASSGLSMRCTAAYDIEPQRADIVQKNCLFLTKKDVKDANYFITNPPYEWSMLQPILEHLPRLLPTWLLLPADMIHNKRMSPYMDICKVIQSVGRLWWFENEEGKKVKGVDNFVWLVLDTENNDFTRFYGR